MHENRRADSEPSWSKLYLDKVPMIKDSLKPRANGRNVVGYYMLDRFAHLLHVVGSCCIRFHTTTNTDATTLNILGPTILGFVASVCS